MNEDNWKILLSYYRKIKGELRSIATRFVNYLQFFYFGRKSCDKQAEQEMHLQLLKPIIVVLAVVVPLWVFARLIIRSRSPKPSPILQSELANILLVAYIAVIVALTILPISLAALQSPKGPGVNLIPFINTYKNYKDSLSSTDLAWKDFALENIIGNVLLFIPMGIIFPARFKRCRSLKMIILISFCSSLLIELIQALLRLLGIHRTADVDDIILNTLGGAIGYLIFLLCNYFFAKPNTKDHHD